MSAGGGLEAILAEFLSDLLRRFLERRAVAAGAGCDCCTGQGNGLLACFDGSATVLVPPSSGGPWVPIWEPGVGWDWWNVGPLMGPGESKAGAKRKTKVSNNRGPK